MLSQLEKVNGMVVGRRNRLKKHLPPLLLLLLSSFFIFLALLQTLRWSAHACKLREADIRKPFKCSTGMRDGASQEARRQRDNRQSLQNTYNCTSHPYTAFPRAKLPLATHSNCICSNTSVQFRRHARLMQM